MFSVQRSVRETNREKEKRERRRTGQLEHLGGEVLEDRGGVDGGLCADADVVLRALLEVPVYTPDRELSNASADACRQQAVSCGKRIHSSQRRRTSSKASSKPKPESESESRTGSAGPTQGFTEREAEGDAPPTRTWRPALELRVWRTFWGALVSAGAAAGALDFPPPFLGGIVRVYVCV